MCTAEYGNPRPHQGAIATSADIKIDHRIVGARMR